MKDYDIRCDNKSIRSSVLLVEKKQSAFDGRGMGHTYGKEVMKWFKDMPMARSTIW
jgi:hypothetical protein